MPSASLVFTIARVTRKATLSVLLMLFAVLCFVDCAAVPAYSAAKARTIVTWEPAKLVRGSPVLFRVTAPPRTRSMTGKWFGHDLQFFREGKSWYALAGIPVETSARMSELEITEALPSGPVTVLKKVGIAPAKYPQITIHVAQKFTNPSPEQLKQISADRDLKKDLFSHQTATRLWEGNFVAPVTAPVSDVFGTERVFNGEVKSRHLGLDYAVPAGTPVHAINDGTVILARPLYFEGGFVVIDHGQGLLSLYLHLSKFEVQEGERVKTGQLIALSGGSGRATGPHLHLAVRWQQMYISPAILLKMRIPD